MSPQPNYSRPQRHWNEVTEIMGQTAFVDDARKLHSLFHYHHGLLTIELRGATMDSCCCTLENVLDNSFGVVSKPKWGLAIRPKKCNWIIRD